LKESAVGDANKTVKFDTKKTFFITSSKRLSSLGTTSAFRSVFNLFKRTFTLPARITEGIEVLGTTPFETSPSSMFSAIFEPSTMPRDIGGMLHTGTDQHCCVGVEQSPRLDDADALWRRYTEAIPASAVSGWCRRAYM